MLTLIVPVFGTYGLKDVTPNRDGNRVIKVIKIVYPNDTFPVLLQLKWSNILKILNPKNQIKIRN